MGLERILRGILKYRQIAQKVFLKDLQDAKSNPNPAAVFISCMDARLYPKEFTLTKAGDMYVMRNAGNMAPADEASRGSIAAGVELGCVHNGIGDVIVCGHSDCKAMGLLWKLRNEIDAKRNDSLGEWVRKHGRQSLLNFQAGQATRKFVLQSPIDRQSVTAVIDEEGRYETADQLSQLHCLQQMVNIAAYPFLSDKLLSGKVRLSAMWIDLSSADVFLFSRNLAKFLKINEENMQQLLK